MESSDLFGAELTEPLQNTENEAGVTELKASLLLLVCRNPSAAHGTTDCILRARGMNHSQKRALSCPSQQH